MWITNPRSAAALASLALLVPAGRASAREPCVWNGTAPRCDGDCEPGYTLVTRDRRGPADAKRCTTGTKARCCLASEIQIVGKAPFCNGKCPAGQETLGESDYGHDGDKCVTGKAAICRLPVNK